MALLGERIREAEKQNVGSDPAGSWMALNSGPSGVSAHFIHADRRKRVE